MPERAILLVESNPSDEDRTDEYNDWYVSVHIPQILERVPGVTGARRYVAHESSPTQPAQRYLAVYEIEAEDVGAVPAALKAAAASGQLDVSSALDTSTRPGMVLYQEL